MAASDRLPHASPKQRTLILLAQIIPGTILPGNPLENAFLEAYSEPGGGNDVCSGPEAWTLYQGVAENHLHACVVIFFARLS
jgi:hypothetical protein